MPTILGPKWTHINAKQFMSNNKLISLPYTEKLCLSNDFLPNITSQATQSFVGKKPSAKSVCVMLNAGVKRGSLSRYAHLCLVNMVQ